MCVNIRHDIYMYVMFFHIGPYPNTTRVRKHFERGTSQNFTSRRLEWILQKFGAVVDETNPIHDDEIRLFREDH